MGNSTIFIPQSPSRELDYSTLNYSPVRLGLVRAGNVRGATGDSLWGDCLLSNTGLLVLKKHLPQFRNPVCNHLCHRQHLLVLMLKESRSDSCSHIWIGSSCDPLQTGQRNSSVRMVSESTPVLSTQPYLAPYQVRPGAPVRVCANGRQTMLYSQPL